MMRYMLAAVLLIVSNTYANETDTPVALGMVWGDTKAVAVGGFNTFDQETPYYDMKRYGTGGGRMQVGNTFGLALSSNTGVFINDEDTDWIVYPRVGFDVGGRYILNTNSTIETYYQWLPLLNVGPHINIGKCKLFISIKGGGTVGNFGHYGILPSVNWAWGAGGYFYYDGAGVSYAKYVFGGHLVEGVDAQYKQFILRAEQTDGLRREEAIMVLWSIK